jgi:hypothetical protein
MISSENENVNHLNRLDRNDTNIEGDNLSKQGIKRPVDHNAEPDKNGGPGDAIDTAAGKFSEWTQHAWNSVRGEKHDVKEEPHPDRAGSHNYDNVKDTDKLPYDLKDPREPIHDKDFKHNLDVDDTVMHSRHTTAASAANVADQSQNPGVVDGTVNNSVPTTGALESARKKLKAGGDKRIIIDK